MAMLPQAWGLPLAKVLLLVVVLAGLALAGVGGAADAPAGGADAAGVVSRALRLAFLSPVEMVSAWRFGMLSLISVAGWPFVETSCSCSQKLSRKSIETRQLDTCFYGAGTRRVADWLSYEPLGSLTHMGAGEAAFQHSKTSLAARHPCAANCLVRGNTSLDGPNRHLRYIGDTTSIAVSL